MRQYKYKKVNAFTSEHSKGNPAAYLMNMEGEFTPEEMLSIGKEHAGFVSEIVFCTKSEKADVKLTYYSSECEVEFCGHGTIATMYDLIENDEKLRAKECVQFETNKKGTLTAYNAIDMEHAIYITAPKPIFLDMQLKIEDIAAALKLHVSQLNVERKIDFIDAGLRTLIVPMQELAAEISVYPEEEKLKQFCMKNSIDIILIYSEETKNPDAFVHTRVFAPKFGYLEDPATGSGNSAFANYMLKYNLWDGKTIQIEQGGDNAEFNTVMLKQHGEDILFGGAATVVIEGHYLI